MQTYQAPTKAPTPTDLSSPYLYKSALIDEQLEDNALAYIQQLCSTFLKKSTKDFKEIYEPDDVFAAYKFVIDKQKILHHKRRTFGLMRATKLFTSIGHSMDLITVSDKLEPFTNRTLYYELAFQVNATLDILEICQDVLEVIIYTKKERNDN